MQWGVVHQNVANKVDAPAVRANEIEVLTPAQVTAVLTSLEGRVLYPIVATALEMRHTGNRIGGSNPSLSARSLIRDPSPPFTTHHKRPGI